MKNLEFLTAAQVARKLSIRRSKGVGGETMVDIKLYNVCALVPTGYKGSVIYCIIVELGQSLYAGRYADLIKDYKDSEDMSFPEGVIDELFTLEQAEQFVDWHKKRFPGIVLSISEVKLPISCDCAPLAILPYDGPSDTLDFSDDKEYDLPFRVVGFFRWRV